MSDKNLRTHDDPNLWPEEQPRIPARRVVAVSTGPHGTPTVFCDDGSVFRLHSYEKERKLFVEWRPLPVVPGTLAERDQE